MCWRKKKITPVAQKKILRCVSCGRQLEDNSLDAQMKHQAETGHHLYTEVLVMEEKDLCLVCLISNQGKVRCRECLIKRKAS